MNKSKFWIVLLMSVLSATLIISTDQAEEACDPNKPFWCSWAISEMQEDSVDYCCCCIYVDSIKICKKDDKSCRGDGIFEGQSEYSLNVVLARETPQVYKDTCGCHIDGLGWTTQLCNGRLFLGDRRPGITSRFNESKKLVNLCNSLTLNPEMQEPPWSTSCVETYECCCGFGRFEIVLSEQDDPVWNRNYEWIDGYDDFKGRSAPISCPLTTSDVALDADCDGEDQYNNPFPWEPECIQKLGLSNSECIEPNLEE